MKQLLSVVFIPMFSTVVIYLHCIFPVQNMSRDEEFVDVEGEDYYENSYANQEVCAMKR